MKMRYLIFKILLLLLISNEVLAQNNYIFLNNSILRGAFKEVISIYEDVNGTPFLHDEWTNSSITMNKGIVYENIPVKINFHTNEVHVLDGNRTEIVLINATFRQVDFNLKFETYKFVTKIHPLDKKLTLFCLLNEGEIKLFKHTERKIVLNKEHYSLPATKKLREEVSLFVELNGKIQKVEKGSGFWYQFLPDKVDEINLFVNSNKTKLKTEKEILQLINHLNKTP